MIRLTMTLFALLWSSLLLSWETTRGLITDYDGTVTGARFKFDPRYQDGTVLLLEWDIATGLPDQPSVTERFSCGNGWTTTDGATAQRSDNGDKFQKSSIYGHIIETAKGDANALAMLQQRGDPTNANIWVGTKWRFEEVELQFGKGSDGQPITSTRVMPVEFLGTEDNPGAGQQAQPQGQGQNPAPAAQSNGSGQLYDQLRPIAEQAPDHKTFVSQALQLEGVQPIIDQVADDGDEGLYQKLKSGAL